MKNLWNQIRARLAHLRRAERIRKRESRREKARTSFLRDPFKYARGLLKEKKSGTLQASEQELEDYIRDHLGDSQRECPLGSPGHVPRPPEPSSLFDTGPPKWTEVRQVVEQARAASAWDQTVHPTECTRAVQASSSFCGS